MEHVCPHCGRPLPEGASFCPGCTKSINRRERPSPPRPISRRVLYAVAALLILLAVCFGIWLTGCPQELEGMGGVLYTDADGTYQVVMAQSSGSYNPIASIKQRCEAGAEYRFPLCVTFYNGVTGENVSHSFREKAAYSSVAFEQPEDGPSPWRATEPAYHQARPDAVHTSLLDHTLESGAARFTWTLHMKNGDTIKLHTDLSTEEIPTLHYYPEDVPMDTLEELQALVDRIGDEVSKGTIVYIHLPPVTYAGGLTLYGQAINLIGSSEGRTTFTGNTQITVDDGYICCLDHLDFRGSGDGIGLSASARVHLTDCNISGWRTGVLAYGSTWVNTMDCRFEDNKIGFHFNASGGSVSHSTYTGNEFIRNGTGVLLESVPTDIALKFPKCIFSGNGTDIDNRCGQELDLSQAVFK